MSTFGYGALAVRETPTSGYPRPRLLDRVREAVRARHYSRRTEKAYVAWTRRYAPPGGWSRHPDDPGASRPPRRPATTMIYTHVLNRGPVAVRSPADRLLNP
jgi:hypothetical protein